jgi:hypothetical protein
MFNSQLDADNVVGMTEADLKQEHKQTMEKAIEDYRHLCLKSFNVNRSGKVIHIVQRE